MAIEQSFGEGKRDWIKVGREKKSNAFSRERRIENMGLEVGDVVSFIDAVDRNERYEVIEIEWDFNLKLHKLDKDGNRKGGHSSRGRRNVSPFRVTIKN